jgi:hypothetical protein
MTELQTDPQVEKPIDISVGQNPVTSIVTEYTANYSVSRTLATLGIPHTETRFDDQRVQFDVELDETDALTLVDLALGR